MPLPTPEDGENRAEFLSRCMSDETTGNEYPDNDQRLAICASQFEERNMTVTEKLLQAIRARQQKQTEFGYGILTADRYVSTLLEQAGPDICNQVMSRNGSSFHDVMQKAAETLVYSNEDMVVEDIEYRKPDGVSQLKRLGKDIELPKNTLMVFRHTLTTPRKDRDGDILRSQGASVDPKMLLLWQHVHTMPIGKMLKIDKHNSKRVSMISAIVDINSTSHDAAVMIDNGMGRFSHGFQATSYDPIKNKDGDDVGFDIKEFEIMEASLVSVPSNTDAETEEVLLSLVEGGKLTSPMMKEYGKTIRDKRPIKVPVTLDIDLLSDETKQLLLKEIKDENEPGNRSGETKETGSGTSKETDDHGKENKDSQDTEVKGFVGKTGTVKGHAHAVSLDGDGSGKTAPAADHSHKVEEFEVIEEEDHTHPLSKGDLTERALCLREMTWNGMPIMSLVPTQDWMALQDEKRGRSLSKANERNIRDALEGIEEALKLDLPRAAQALLRESRNGLKTVMESVGEEETETLATHAEPTVKEAMALVIQKASPEERETLRGVFNAIDKAKESEIKATEFRALRGPNKE